MFKDKRIERRFGDFLKKSYQKKSLVIHQLADSESEQRGYYRMLYNEKFNQEELCSFLYSDCVEQVTAGEHYLLIQDTTQMNFESNRSNIVDEQGFLGVIGDNKSLGFFLHPSLLVSVSDNRSLGFADVQYWSRLHQPSLGASAKRMRNAQRAIEDKESYRWLSSIKAARLRLPPDCKLTCICDREGDISELFERATDEHTNLLIRSRDNRRLKDGEKLYEYLDSLPVMGSYEIKISGDKRVGRVGRTARIELKYSAVTLVPASLKGKEIEVFAIEAREEAKNLPKGQKPIHWRLLTTHHISSYQEAKTMIDYYKERWLIEQIFRLLKNKGLQIENSQIESAKALVCLSILGLLLVNKVLLLHEASKETTPIAVKKTFSKQEMACLRACNAKYEGNTYRQKNPYPPDSLQWVYWVLARMGGWKPHEKRAGVISIFRGLQYFLQVFEGWKLAHFVS